MTQEFEDSLTAKLNAIAVAVITTILIEGNRRRWTDLTIARPEVDAHLRTLPDVLDEAMTILRLATGAVNEETEQHLASQRQRGQDDSAPYR